MPPQAKTPLPTSFYTHTSFLFLCFWCPFQCLGRAPGPAHWARAEGRAAPMQYVVKFQPTCRAPGEPIDASVLQGSPPTLPSEDTACCLESLKTLILLHGRSTHTVQIPASEAGACLVPTKPLCPTGYFFCSTACVLGTILPLRGSLLSDSSWIKDVEQDAQVPVSIPYMPCSQHSQPQFRPLRPQGGTKILGYQVRGIWETSLTDT